MVLFTAHRFLLTHPALQAPAMEWHEGHSWTLDVQLPVGAVNFKVVMQEPHGGVRWEQGTDRSAACVACLAMAVWVCRQFLSQYIDKQALALLSHSIRQGKERFDIAIW